MNYNIMTKAINTTYSPKCNEVFKWGYCNVETIQQRISEKQNKIFVIGVANTVVNPEK